MPYRDPDKRRAYDRERKRAERAGRYPVSPTRLPAEFRVQVMGDISALLEEAIQLIQNDESARGVERGRALLSACTIALRVAEARDVLTRLDDIERAMKEGLGDGKGYF
jgi:hypothetical protein